MSKNLRVFIGGIAARSDFEDIEKYFTKIGNLESCKIKVNKKTGKCIGYGYITCSDQQTYDKIVNQKHSVNGKVIDCKPLLKKDKLAKMVQDERSKKLFVGNLDKTTKSEALLEYFKEYGTIQNAYIICHPGTEESRGFGFVHFEDRKSVDKVFDKEGHKIEGKDVSCSKFLNKKEQMEFKMHGINLQGNSNSYKLAKEKWRKELDKVEYGFIVNLPTSCLPPDLLKCEVINSDDDDKDEIEQDEDSDVFSDSESDSQDEFEEILKSKKNQLLNEKKGNVEKNPKKEYRTRKGFDEVNQDPSQSRKRGGKKAKAPRGNTVRGGRGQQGLNSNPLNLWPEPEWVQQPYSKNKRGRGANIRGVPRGENPYRGRGRNDNRYQQQDYYGGYEDNYYYDSSGNDGYEGYKHSYPNSRRPEGANHQRGYQNDYQGPRDYQGYEDDYYYQDPQQIGGRGNINERGRGGKRREYREQVYEHDEYYDGYGREQYSDYNNSVPPNAPMQPYYDQGQNQHYFDGGYGVHNPQMQGYNRPPKQRNLGLDMTPPILAPNAGHAKQGQPQNGAPVDFFGSIPMQPPVLPPQNMAMQQGSQFYGVGAGYHENYYYNQQQQQAPPQHQQDQSWQNWDQYKDYCYSQNYQSQPPPQQPMGHPPNTGHKY